MAKLISHPETFGKLHCQKHRLFTTYEWFHRTKSKWSGRI